MQSFKNKYYDTDEDILNLQVWYLAAVPELCNSLKINIMLLMKIYLIYKFSILVLGSILMDNNVVFVLLIN